jgi:hypothetical protein
VTYAFYSSQSTVDISCWAEVCFGEDVVEEEVTVDEADAVEFRGIRVHASQQPR